MPYPPRSDFGILQFNTRVRELLGTAFPYPVWLRGEISGKPRLHSRGHLYFQVIERSPLDDSVIASIDCALFAGSRAVAVREFARAGRVFELEEGSPVRILGRVDMWPPSGRFQFIVEMVDPESVSTDQTILLKLLVDKLRKDGLLDRNSKLRLTVLPLRVGLITAGGSAALEDFLTTLRESGFPFDVWIAPAPMQGAGTPAGVALALRLLTRIKGLDVVAITRGGGSASDLAAFNSEALARAIAAAPWPVISGIGHEVDFTLPDFAAHTRAKTPTHAAQIIVDRVSDFASDLAALSRMLAATAVPKIRAEKRRLESLGTRLQSSFRSVQFLWSAEMDRFSSWMQMSVDRRMTALSSTLDAVAGRMSPEACLGAPEKAGKEIRRLAGMLVPSADRLLANTGTRLGLISGAISSRDPSRMLALGWSIVTTDDGKVLRSVEDTSPGRSIRVRVSDGSVLARTEEIQR